jgi:hypothetical protein
MDIVINTCHGGFSLSQKARDRIGLDESEHSLERNDPRLVQVVRELGEEANGRYARLNIVSIPDDVAWTICDYDGDEWIAEVHRTWR